MSTDVITELSGVAQFVFGLLSTAARKGERCPANYAIGEAMRQNGWIGGKTRTQDALTELREEGFIRIEISARNWRTVVITAGPDTGCATQRSASTAYRVLDMRGDRCLANAKRRAA